MSAAYQAREQQLLERLAWQTLNDPKSTLEDKRAARARLEHKPIDPDCWDRCSNVEADIWAYVNRKVAGEPVWGRDGLGNPITGHEAGHAFNCQVLADDARRQLDVAAAACDLTVVTVSGYEWQFKHPHLTCAACGRLEAGMMWTAAGWARK